MRPSSSPWAIEPDTAGRARMLRARSESGAVPKWNAPRKNSPSTGPTRGPPFAVTVPRCRIWTPPSRGASSAASMRQSSLKMRRRCAPARARERSSRLCSLTRSSGVSCILGEQLLGQPALRLGQAYVGMAADRTCRHPDVAERGRDGERRHPHEPARTDLPAPALVSGRLRLVAERLLQREHAALAVLARRARGVDDETIAALDPRTARKPMSWRAALPIRLGIGPLAGAGDAQPPGHSTSTLTTPSSIVTGNASTGT